MQTLAQTLVQRRIARVPRSSRSIMASATASKSSSRPYKVVVWGASGFTGRLVCEHLAKDYAGQFKWAMAGRNQQKIESVRSELAKQAPTVEQIDVVTADANDQESLERMAASTEVVISLVGPYARYGKPLVTACVKKGTHYCDLTGEPQFIQWSISNHHDAAAKSGTRVVHCCGFDSVPTELTTLLAVNELKSKHRAQAARGEFLLISAMGGFSGGTIESIIGLFQEPDSVKKPALHPYALDPNAAGKPLSECTDKGLSLGLKKSPFTGSWTAPFLGAAIDEPVVRRSNALLGYGPDFSYTERTQGGNIVKAALITFFLGAFGLFIPLAARFPLLRKLLPAPSQGPSRKTMEGGHFHVQNTVEGTDSSGAKIRTRSYMKDPHRDPGYLSTSRLILECALCLCLQSEDVAKDPWAARVSGGVLNPASACGLVLAERCKAAGCELGAETLTGDKKAA